MLLLVHLMLVLLCYRQLDTQFTLSTYSQVYFPFGDQLCFKKNSEWNIMQDHFQWEWKENESEQPGKFAWSINSATDCNVVSSHQVISVFFVVSDLLVVSIVSSNDHWYVRSLTIEHRYGNDDHFFKSLLSALFECGTMKKVVYANSRSKATTDFSRVI